MRVFAIFTAMLFALMTASAPASLNINSENNENIPAIMESAKEYKEKMGRYPEHFSETAAVVRCFRRGLPVLVESKMVKGSLWKPYGCEYTYKIKRKGGVFFVSAIYNGKTIDMMNSKMSYEDYVTSALERRRSGRYR